MQLVPFRLILSLLFFLPAAAALMAQDLRPPAVPLVTMDPFTSVWSFGDHLYEAPTQHWTGRPQQMNGSLRVDGKTYRFLGSDPLPAKTILPSAENTAYPSRYTTGAPAAGWMQPGFPDAGWQSGRGDYGNMAGSKTRWETPEIWVRREFDLADVTLNKLLLYLCCTKTT